MFGNAKKHANRVGLRPVKVLFSIHIGSLTLARNCPIVDQANLSVCFERGGKVSSTGNVIYERPTFVREVVVPFNQKVELVATLYKDFKTNRHQEKVGKIILRELVKGGHFGSDSYKGVGRYSLALHSLMDQMGFERSLTKEQTIKLELVAGATLSIVITATIMSTGSGSEETQSVASYMTEGSDMSTMAASFAYHQHPRPASAGNTTLSTGASLSEANPTTGTYDEGDSGKDGDQRPAERATAAQLPALRSPFNYRSGKHAIQEAADDWGDLDGSSHKDNSGGSAKGRADAAGAEAVLPAQQDATPSARSAESTTASTSASTVPVNTASSALPQDPFGVPGSTKMGPASSGGPEKAPGSAGRTTDALVTVQLSSTSSDGGDGGESSGGGGSTKSSAQGSAQGKEPRSQPRSFLSKILKPLRGAPGKEDRLKVNTSRDSANWTASPPLSPVLLGIDALAAPDSTRSLSSSETSREAFALYDQELRRRAQHIAQLEQALSDQTRQCNAQLHSLRLELEHTAAALKKERVARAVIAEVTHRGDDLLAAALSEARDEAVSAQGQFEEASAELQAVKQELQQYQEQVAAMQRRQAEEMAMAQQAAAVAAEASVRRAEAEEEGQSLLDSLIAVKMEHANMSLELEQARRSNALLQRRLLGYAQQVAGLEVRLAKQATAQGWRGAEDADEDDHHANRVC